MNVVRRTLDGLSNIVTRWGTSADRTTHTTYTRPILAAGEVEAAYDTGWFGKIVDIKAEDSVREWREWQVDREDMSAISDVENTLAIRSKLMQADKWAMRDGGALLVLGLPGPSDQPVNWNAVGKGALKFVVAMPRSMVTATDQIRDPFDPGYGTPAFYGVNGATGVQVRIHPSRVVRLVGVERSADGQWDGWGDSLYHRLKDSLQRVDLIASGAAIMVQEAKVDVLGVPGLMEHLATAEYETLMLQRIALAGQTKGMMNTLLIDTGKGDGVGAETFETKELSFTGLPDLMDRSMMMLAGMADIPQTRMFGRAPQGMNATGESDAANYANMVKARQELKLTPALRNLDEAIVRSALGKLPEGGSWYNWRPLYNESEATGATIEKTYADAFVARVNTSAFDNEALARAELNRMIESGRYPGIEDNIAESDNDGVIDPEVAAAEAEAEAEALAAANANQPPRRVAANDAQPRTLYVRRDVMNAAEIAAWARSQGMQDVHGDLHVTLIYSTTPVDWIKAGNASDWGGDDRGRLTVPPGGPRVVEPLGGETAVLMFASTVLQWRHEAIVRDAGAVHGYPDYIPHISLTRSPVDLEVVEPYRGQIVLGPEIFEEIRL